MSKFIKTEFGELRRVFKPKSDNQVEYIRSMIENDIVFCAGPAGSGKAQPVDSIVYTPNIPCKISDLKVGSIVCTPNGNTAKVVGVYPQGIKPVYKVHFSDQTFTECCKEHLWTIESPNNFQGRKTLSLQEIIEYGLYTDSGKRKVRIPLSEPVYFHDKPLPLDPYLMGLLLGDGCFSNKVGISSSDDEIINYIINAIDGNHKLTKNGEYDYIISKRNNKLINKYKKIIEELNLLNKKSYEKFIPKIYLVSSIKDRWELFYGLMDSDGTISQNGKSVTFTTTSKQLSDDFVLLVQSLGGTVTVSERQTSYTYKGKKKLGRLSYRHYIKLNTDKFFKLARKQDKVTERTKYFPQRYIEKIEYSRNTKCVCIKLDSQDELYLTNNFIVTHNTACAIGLAVSHLCEGKKSKIIITRPTVGTDEDGSKGIGYLPGDIKEKMDPYLRPIFDELNTYFTKHEVDNMIRQDVIEIAPLYYMRGRTFHDAFVILDEAQNATHVELKMITTRLGRKSKLVINGDVNQFDRRFKKCPLKVWISEIINEILGIGVIELQAMDIVRHPIVSAILHKVENFEKNQPK